MVIKPQGPVIISTRSGHHRHQGGVAQQQQQAQLHAYDNDMVLLELLDNYTIDNSF
jgi:hypothetical protein